MEIYIPGYIQNNLFKLQHPIPKNTEDELLKADTKQYEANVQFVKEEDGMPALSTAAI